MKGHQTQWAAQFAVASELCKQNYEVAFTLGHNTPLADLMVISPEKKSFLVDVKGLSSRNPWLLKRKDLRDDLYYVLAFVPKDEINRYFILTQIQANKLVEEHLNRPSANEQVVPRWDGFKFAAPAEFENCWKALPP